MRGIHVLFTLVAALLLQPQSAAAAERYVDPVFDAVRITRDVPYGRAVNNYGDLQQLRPDIYEPAGDRARSRQAVVFAHGGGFQSGSKQDRGTLPFLEALAERGYVVLTIDYRIRPPGSPGHQGGPRNIADSIVGDAEPIRDAQHDFQAAVRWTRRHAAALGIDPATIVASGSSAGAVTALSVGFNPEDPGESGNPGISSAVAAVVSLWGAADSDHIEAGAPPIVGFHGAMDRIVPLPLFEVTCDRTIALGNVCERFIWADADHVAWERLDEIVPTTTSFLCRRVIDECDAPTPVPVQFGRVRDTPDLDPEGPADLRTDPASPANDTTPRVIGTAPMDAARVEVYVTGDCTGPAAPGDPATSRVIFEREGIEVTVPANETTAVSARAFDAAGNPSPCSEPISYVEDSAPPERPSDLETTPASPAEDVTPMVRGTATADTDTVEIFTSSDCAGPATSAEAGDFTGEGIELTVPAGQTTPISARALDAAGNASRCSDPIDYVEGPRPQSGGEDSDPGRGGPPREPARGGGGETGGLDREAPRQGGTVGIGGGVPAGGTRCFTAATQARKKRLGRAGLGNRRSNVRRTFGAEGRYRRFLDRYCLADDSTIRVGYPSHEQLRRLVRRERKRLRGKASLVLTSSERSTVRGVNVGDGVRELLRKTGRRAGVRVGGNVWYVRRGQRAGHVFKVQDGIVREVGLADRQQTATNPRVKRFFTSGR